MSFGRKRRVFMLVVGITFFILAVNLLSMPRDELAATIQKVPGVKKPSALDDLKKAGFDKPHKPKDEHPISKLMAEADQRWRVYEGSRSLTFKDAVAKYRRNYGRHPPPGFDEWYKFARKRNVWNIDDFDQIMDDIRPFWAVPPQTIRTLAAHMWEKVDDDGLSCISIRNHKIAKENNPGWRSETMVKMIERVVEFIPDMDIEMNRLDQPRVVVPWDEMQAMLKKEAETRVMLPETSNSFTSNMSSFLDLTMEVENDTSPREDAGWFSAPGRQYMEIAREACPPESHARNPKSVKEAEALYKDRMGGIITNFNRSSDLCTIGPEIQDLHGFLFSASSQRATNRLVPVFGECKVNVNSDILFPANMYWKQDDRYDYNGKYDVDWEKKDEKIIWRGVTSGGVNVPESHLRMHRQRLVVMLNGTEMQDQEVRILSEQPEAPGEYENYRQFKPSEFANNYTDVGFVETVACFPNCTFLYGDTMEIKEQVTLAEQFKSRYVVDVDGHSFSGRWRAFLQSRSLGIKATIFREWHDSRLFAWRHFVPMDNRYDDIYSLLTYFIGVGKSGAERRAGEPYVARHDVEAKRIALQGREWANKVLRSDDIEIYMFRLLLEYGRVIDDNRDRIGYSGDGSELDKFDGTGNHW